MVGKRIDDIVIVGGGTAGWLAAAYLAGMMRGKVTVTVVETPSAAQFGESSTPLLRGLLVDGLAVDENEWLRGCDASFTMAVKLVNWCTPGESDYCPRSIDGRSDHFYRPFGTPPAPISRHWFRMYRDDEIGLPYDYACFREPPIIDAMRAPCRNDGTPVTSYAWHFNEELLMGHLRHHARHNYGVKCVPGEPGQVVLDEHGYVTELRLTDGRRIPVDLVVDCSGDMPINEALDEPFVRLDGHLPCDSVVSTYLPYGAGAPGIEPCTSAIAMKHGWAWRIPRLGGFATGYVYADEFTDQDQAAGELCRMWGLDPDRAECQHTRLKIGYHRRSWVRNRVRIGPAAGSLGPLESTDAHLICLALRQLVRHLPDQRIDPAMIDDFNRSMETEFADHRDFLQAHFRLSPRADTAFWRAGQETPITDDLAEKITRYRTGQAIHRSGTDYECILTGLGVLPGQPPASNDRPLSIDNAFSRIQREQRRLVADLPDHRAYLVGLHYRAAQVRPIHTKLTRSSHAGFAHVWSDGSGRRGAGDGTGGEAAF